MADADPGDQVVLVDEDDRAVGAASKQAAHRPPGQLHRALSAFVFDDGDRVLLQRRAEAKYHFGGLWSNSCCTHPRPGEPVLDAGHRRLFEELGLRCELEQVGSFRYRAVDEGSGLVEHEVDHVLVGRCTGAPTPDPREVAEVRYATLAELRTDLVEAPDRYTPWLADALALVVPPDREVQP